ncbi:MAG: 30S ribosomal protein S21 [Firmicutes bacterium]|nr:30S ribosomal protein S21 [Bacillota bacterium]
MATVRLGEGETVESGLRKFKRKVQRDGVIKDIKKKDSYVGLSERKKLKKENAIKRDRKKDKR